jgi:hypothetical protein
MVDAHFFPFLLPFPFNLGEIVLSRQRLHASRFLVNLLA